MSTPGHVHHHLLCHQREPNFPCASLEDPPKPAGRSGPSSYKTVAFALSHSGHKTLFQSSNNGISISLKFIGLVQSSPTDFQSQRLWWLLLLMPDTQIGKPEMGLGTLIPIGELLKYNYSPICGWWDLIICEYALSIICCGFFVFGCRISFLEDRFQSF